MLPEQHCLYAARPPPVPAAAPLRQSMPTLAWAWRQTPTRTTLSWRWVHCCTSCCGRGPLASCIAQCVAAGSNPAQLLPDLLNATTSVLPLPPLCICSTRILHIATSPAPLQGCLASGRVSTAMDVHSTMLGAGQEGNERTHELLVEAGVVSGAPGWLLGEGCARAAGCMGRALLCSMCRLQCKIASLPGIGGWYGPCLA